jgi:protein-disulfide isomerase
MDKPTKAELKEIRKTEWQMKAEKAEKDAKIRKITTWGGAAIGFLIFIGLLVWLVSSPSSNSNSNIKIADVTSKDVSTGPADSKVVLVEYSDFQCPACKAYHDQVLKTLIPAYKDRVKFVYRFFPLPTVHQNAIISARAGYAAHLQGKFWEMNDLLFTNQNDWAKLSDADARNFFNDYASKLKMDVNKFKKDIDSDAVKTYVTDEQNEGTNAGVNSTPTFFLNGEQLKAQTFEDFKKLLDDALKTTK